MPRKKIDCFQIKCVFGTDLQFFKAERLNALAQASWLFLNPQQKFQICKGCLSFCLVNTLNSAESITQTYVWYFSKWSLVMQRNMNLDYKMFVFLHIFSLKLFMKSVLPRQENCTFGLHTMLFSYPLSCFASLKY